LSIPSLIHFLFDRVWYIVYPYPYSLSPRKENEKTTRYVWIKTLYEKGFFNKWSDNAWKLYRTLKCIQLGLKRLDIEDITPERCRELKRYGKHEIFSFYYNDSSDLFCIQFTSMDNEGITKFIVRERCFDREQIMSLRSYQVIDNETNTLYKLIIYRVNPWTTVVLRPHLVNIHKPHFIRILVNNIVRSKYELGLIDLDNNFVFQHNNFVDPMMLGDRYKNFVELNHKLTFDYNEIKEIANELLETWFGPEYNVVDWVISLSSLELSYDSYESKEKLISYGYYTEASVKVSRAEIPRGRKKIENEYFFDDIALKLLITINKGRNHLQLKIYTKAFNKNSGKELNRLEYSIGVHKRLDKLKIEDILYREDLVKIHETIMKLSRMDSNEFLEKVKNMVSVFTNECKNYEFYNRCINFWIDMIIAGGELKGSEYYRDVAKLFKEKNMIKIKGRGRNSWYIVSNEYYSVVKEFNKIIEEYLGDIKQTIHPNPYTKNEKQNKTK